MTRPVTRTNPPPPELNPNHESTPNNSWTGYSLDNPNDRDAAVDLQPDSLAELETTGRRDVGEPRFHPPWHFQALHMSMAGYNVREIGKAVNRNFVTIYKFLHTPWAQREVERLYNEVTAKRTAVLLDPVEKFNAKIDEKIQLLDDLTRNEDPKVALAAIKEWINHSIGSPVKRTEITVEHSLNNLGVEELRFIKEHGRMPLPAELRTLQIEAGVPPELAANHQTRQRTPTEPVAPPSEALVE